MKCSNQETWRTRSKNFRKAPRLPKKEPWTGTYKDPSEPEKVTKLLFAYPKEYRMQRRKKKKKKTKTKKHTHTTNHHRTLATLLTLIPTSSHSLHNKKTHQHSKKHTSLPPQHHHLPFSASPTQFQRSLCASTASAVCSC